MKTFEVTLKNEKEKSYRFIILLLVVLHTLFFVYLLFDHSVWKKGVTGLTTVALYSGYRLLVTNTSKQKFSFGSGFFFLFGVIGIIDIWWLGVIDMVLFILSSTALLPLAFTFDPSHISKSPFPFRKYQWDQLSNVILKDSILTLDFKNNKLLQAEIETKNIDDEAFNIFAKEQLIKNN